MGPACYGTSRLDLSQLEVKAAQLISLGISPSTAEVYDAGKKAYLKFCARFNFTPIPAQEEVLILFVTELSQTLVYNSVRTYLAGVRHLHVVKSAGNPLQDKLRLQLTLAGIRRWKPKAGGTYHPAGAESHNKGVGCRIHRLSEDPAVGSLLLRIFRVHAIG